MLCPYCNIGISDYPNEWSEDAYPIPSENGDFDKGYIIRSIFCPDCLKFIAFLQEGRDYIYSQHGSYFDTKGGETILLYPKFPINKSISSHVPKKYSDIYLEASQVNHISPRASATLSHYLLQMILHEELKIKK